ncbi:sulfate transporter CysZ [Psychrobium sp. 1_MG-2023]|uniref:sulfate transporter CysZ n=1 Tax=Psychrobium sp. 1_MG-2023 TaxID=3062624 RepID=UPI00267E9DCD|nr:sulfate transporter CysZ [Psychrobium sp. 1_MG-2023]MDP2560172.1 sulfate transporter CysZ [Psychrobium sp. 1_MG-2023]
MFDKSRSGASYFLKGFDLIQTKGLRSFVLIPLIVNVLLFSSAFYYLFLQLDGFFVYLDGYLPEFLSWLKFILWPLAVISLLVVFSFLFSSVANWIAAPFNGLLAEKVECHLTGQPAPTTTTADVVKDIPRTLHREWTKLAYYLPRAIGCLILFFIPIVGQTVAPVLWFLFSAWMMAIQYCDYPFDNHKRDFKMMKSQLKQDKGCAFSFGAMTTLFSMIPIVNLVVMPVAICGATALWVERYREHHLDENTDDIVKW